MKRLFSLIILAMLAVSCEGPVGPEGPPGRPGNDGSLNLEVYDFRVGPNGNKQWTRKTENDGTNQYFEASFNDFTELTSDIYNYGIIKVYYDNDDGLQQEIPFVRPREDGNDRWTEVTDFTFSPGKISFFVTYSDFADTYRAPGNMLFRVVMAW